MHTIIDDGIVLSVRPHQDYDRLYRIYTRGLGKISIIAKGAQKPKSKLSSHLLVGAKVKIMIATGKSFYRLAGVQLDRYTDHSDQSFLVLISYLCEALDNLVIEKSPDVALFDLVSDYSDQLSQTADHNQRLVIANQVVFAILTHLGYQPEKLAANQRALWQVLYQQVVSIIDRPLNSFQLTRVVMELN